MRYKDYVWPHNPRVYTIGYERTMGAQKVPFGRYWLQDLGPAQRVMRGEGEFVGADAYQQFKALASVFYSDGPGLLVHPVWQTAWAYFVELSLAQEPRADYVRYTFTFWEGYEGHNTGVTVQAAAPAQTAPTTAAAAGTAQAQWHTVRQGESMWSIARSYGLTLDALIALNPQIKNPSRIQVGQQVRVA